MTPLDTKARLRRFWIALKPWVLLRLRQPSTYLGVLLKVGGIVGLPLTESAAGQLAEVLAIVAGAALFAWDQSSKPDPTDQEGA